MYLISYLMMLNFLKPDIGCPIYELYQNRYTRKDRRFILYFKDPRQDKSYILNEIECCDPYFTGYLGNSYLFFKTSPDFVEHLNAVISYIVIEEDSSRAY